MKTFLWTTLFWIVAAIAWLLCLGFGNLWTQVLDNEWIASVMPKNLKAESCDTVLEKTLENIDWCAAAESYDCAYENTESESNSGDLSDTTRLQEPLSSIIANQEIIYNYLQESVANINQSITDLQNNMYVPQETEDTVIDEKEQHRLELQAQIEALQKEMDNL